MSGRFFVSPAFVLATVLGGIASTTSAAQRIEQLAEDGVTTRYLAPAAPSLSAPQRQVCEVGAKWIRLSFAELTLAPYDSLTLTSSAGDHYTFEGSAWNGRRFAARALRGDCVSIRPSFGSAASRVLLESYQFGTQDLATTSVVVAGAGDICDSTGNACQGTSDLIVNINPTAVFTAGDNAYDSGTLTQYNTNYAPTWGRFKTLTNPTPGNHEYNTSNASGYFDYFNGAGNQTGPAGDRSKGYYSWNVGDWHFIALNTMSGGTVATAQLTWLQGDLDANTKPCIAAYWHHPLVSHGNYTGYTQVKPFWDKLYAAHADLVLVGHDHNYQRYGLMKPDQTADAANGIRQILVGTGGRAFYSLASNSDANLQASNANSHGILKLTLTATGYTGDFVHSTGTFSDTFSGTCHAKTASNQTPVANFSFATNGLIANFTDGSTDADGTIATRSWNFGDSGTSTAANPSHTYATAGTYSVSLTVTDDKGATNAISKSVSVTTSNAAPVASFSFNTSGLTATFADGSTDSDGTIASRTWNFGDGGTSTATNPSHAYAAAGTFNVSLTVTDNAGASNSITKSVSVIAPPPNVLQNGVAVTNLSATAGNSVNYTMDVPAGATSLKFAIAGGTGDADLYVKFGAAPTDSVYDCRPYASGNAESCPITTAQAGTYYVRVKAYASYTGVSLTGSYTAPGSNLPPSANFSFTTSNLVANFTDTSSDSDGSIVSRSWNFGDSTSSTAANPSHSYGAAGTYNVSLTVTDNSGATNTKTQSVTVTSSGNVLQNGVAVTNLAAGTGATLNYTMNVPAGATNLKFVIAGGSGDADLYVKFGAAPTTSSYDCRPYKTGNSESCSITPAQAGTYYVMLRGYAAFSGVGLTGSYTP